MRQKINAILFVLFSLVACFSSLSAQDTLLNGLGIEAKVKYGSVIPHHSSVGYVLEENIVGFDLAFLTASNNRHHWEPLYRNPRYGIGYSFLRLGNDEVLGNLNAIYGLIDIPFHIPRRKQVFSYQINWGLGFMNTVYDSYDNPLNLMISLPVNVYIGFDLSSSFKIGDKNELKTSLEFTHCSNGKTSTPNLGVNIATLSASWMYELRPMTRKSYTKPVFDYQKHNVEFLINAGGKRDEDMRSEVFLVSSGIVDYYYSYRPRYAFGVGGDMFYDASLARYALVHDGIEGSESTNYQYGLHLGFRARYNKMYLIVNAGGYVSYEFLRYGRMYSRIGLRYALSDAILLNFTLKAHNTIADFIELGVGYRLQIKNK